MKNLSQLLAGYQLVFQQNFERENPLYKELARNGQSPKVMVISCSDSRVDPSIITHAGPGEIFAIRNVANLVPPLSMASRMDHSTPAALEYAVCVLKVAHIVLMGHSQCGGIRALLEGFKTDQKDSFIQDWLAIGAAVRDRVMAEGKGASLEELAHRSEHEVLHQSLDNLMTYPWVAAAVTQGKLSLHAWHFDIATGKLEELDIHWRAEYANACI